VAPAEGLLVERDGYRGAFTIVTGLQDLVVEAEAKAAEAAYVRPGRPAYVSSGEREPIVLHAIVRSIGAAENRASSGTFYPVTLSVANPRNILPDRTEVDITIQSAARD
jgi:hypothetical protein